MPSGGQNKLNREVLLEDIASVAAIVDRETPRLADYREHGHHSAKAIYNEFDSWNAALDALDLDVHQRKNKERVEYECDNPDCSDVFERLPAELEETGFNYCSQDCHYEHKSELYSGDGNPQGTLEPVACEACEDQILRARWKRRQNGKHFCDNDCYSKWCSEYRYGENHHVWEEYPTNECDWCGKGYKVKPALQDESRFCSLNCINNWKSDAYTGDGNHNWEGGKDQYMGANWPEQRRKAIVRDQGRCRDCGMTEAVHLEEKGRGLHVHHLTPRKEFVNDGVLNWREANAISNLITVCSSCHSVREGNS